MEGILSRFDQFYLKSKEGKLGKTAQFWTN